MQIAELYLSSSVFSESALLALDKYCCDARSTGIEIQRTPTFGLGAHGRAQLPARLGGRKALVVVDELLVIHALVLVRVRKSELLQGVALDLGGLHPVLRVGMQRCFSRLSEQRTASKYVRLEY